MPWIQNSNSTSIPANRGGLLKIVGGGSLVFAGQTLGSEVIGVFATAAPAVGKLVSCCVFCPTAAESLDSLSGITGIEAEMKSLVPSYRLTLQTLPFARAEPNSSPRRPRPRNYSTNPAWPTQFLKALLSSRTPSSAGWTAPERRMGITHCQQTSRPTVNPERKCGQDRDGPVPKGFSTMKPVS